MPCKYYLTKYYSEDSCFNVDKVDEKCNAITICSNVKSIDATFFYKIQEIKVYILLKNTRNLLFDAIKSILLNVKYRKVFNLALVSI